MKSINNQYKKMLDIGCGPGTINNIYYYDAFHKTHLIHGVDLLLKNIEEIKRRFPHGKFRRADAESLPYAANTFDMILCRHVLEHVYSLKEVLSEMKRVGKDGAEVRVAVPHEFFENIMVSLISDYIGTGHHHQRIFRQGELIKAMKSVGFEVIRVRDQKWPMFIIVLLFALVSKMTHRVTMEEQSGVFELNKKSYIHTRSTSELIKIGKFLHFIESFFWYFNFMIPFETEIVAKIVKRSELKGIK